MQQDNIPDSLQHRDVTHGKFSVSIGTSIAIETIFNLNDNVPPVNPAPYTKYKMILINVRTLLRNLFGAVNLQLKEEWNATRYLERLRMEIDKIPEIIANQSKDGISTVFYIATLRDLEREFPKAILKRVSTKAVSGQHYEAVEQYCIAQIMSLALDKKINVFITQYKLPVVDERTLILTHMPIDLLSYRHNPAVDLLESHTGTIKPRFRWHTKLRGSGLDRIPFDNWSIQLFGDGKTFNAYPIKYRNAMIALANDKKWGQNVTPTLIKLQLKYIQDPDVRKLVESLL